MSQHAWFEHFKERLQGLTESFEQNGTNMSLLGYALSQNLLNADDYIAWAVNHYKLPLLQKRFFTETPPSQEMFAKWATHYPWSSECLPVAEWDGALIVACLQPPQDFPSTPPCILVLSSYEGLEQSWLKFQEASKVTAAPAAAPASELPDGIDITMPIAAEAKKSSDTFSFDDLDAGSDESSPSEENEGIEGLEEHAEPNEALDGLFDAPTVVKLEALSPSSALSEKSAPAITPKTESVVKSDSTATSPLLTPLTPLTPAEPVAAKPAMPSTPPPAPAPAAALKAVETLLKAAPPVAPATPVKTAPPPPPIAKPVVAAAVPDIDVAEESAPPEDSFGNKQVEQVTNTKPISIAKPVLNAAADLSFLLEKMKKKNGAVLNDRVKLALSEMKAYFDKAMILTIDDKESQLTAFAWDENFHGVKDTSMKVPLRTPSIFNIVAATSKPYHGYINLNEINERFFETWNEGRVPDHITITPLIVNDKILGMLVGFADKSAYNKLSLSLAEKLSTEFVKGLHVA